MITDAALGATMGQLPVQGITGHNGCGPVPMMRLVRWPSDPVAQQASLEAAWQSAVLAGMPVLEPRLPAGATMLRGGDWAIIVSVPHDVGGCGVRHRFELLERGPKDRVGPMFEAWCDLFDEHSADGSCRWR